MTDALYAAATSRHLDGQRLGTRTLHVALWQVRPDLKRQCKCRNGNCSRPVAGHCAGAASVAVPDLDAAETAANAVASWLILWLQRDGRCDGPRRLLNTKTYQRY